MDGNTTIADALGDLRDAVDERVRSGRYASAGEVIRAALDALDREEAALESDLREKVRASLADPSPSIPAEEVFAELRTMHAERVKRARGGA
jgi:antitoxin ParD1/3/4